MVGTLDIGKVGETAHSDFIAVVEDRELLGEYPGHHHLELVGAVARTGVEPEMVVIAGDGGEIAPVGCPPDGLAVTVAVFEEHVFGIHTPVYLVFRPRIAVEVLQGLFAAVEGEIDSTVRLMLLVEVHAAVA